MTTMPCIYLKTANDAMAYILNSGAIFTIASNVTGQCFTYKMSSYKRKPYTRFISVKAKYGYRCVCIIKGKRHIFRNNNLLFNDYASYKAFVWAWRHISNGSMPSTMSVYVSSKKFNIIIINVINAAIDSVVLYPSQ